MIILSVIVPCFNEEKNIFPLVTRLTTVFKKLDILAEIVLVNDCSLDNTKQVIEKAATEFERIVLVDHTKNKGIVGAWESGVLKASGQYVAIMDGDMQYAPEDVQKLYMAKITGEDDIVQGVRAVSYDQGSMRHFLSKGFAGFLNFIFNCKSLDIKSGFLLCQKSVFESILAVNKGYIYYQHFIGIAAISLGYTIQEIPVTFGVREAGSSFIKFPLFFALRSLLDLPFAFIQFRFKKLNV